MNRKGQSTMEYAVVIAVVVGALLAMQIYMKRGMQGKLRESADQIGEQYSAGNMRAKVTTEQKGVFETRETFGLEEDGVTEKKGVSYYKITADAPSVVRSAQGDDAEKITKALNEEKLFNSQKLNPY